MMDQETSSGTSSSGTDSDDDDLPFGGSPAVYCTNCTSRLVLGTVCMVSADASCTRCTPQLVLGTVCIVSCVGTS